MQIESDKSYATAVCLSAVFGIIGVQHFYLGRYFLGITDLMLSILMLYFFINDQLFLGLFFFALDFTHTLITTILLLIGSFKDGKGHLICYPGQKLSQ